MKDEDYEYIKRFSSISISKLAKRLGINRQSIYSKNLSKEKMHELRTEIEFEVAKLYYKNKLEEENIIEVNNDK